MRGVRCLHLFQKDHKPDAGEIIKKYKMIFIGLALALFSAIVGLSSAMTPGPSGGDKANVLVSMLFFIGGIGLIIAGIVKAIKQKIRSNSETSA